MPSLTLFSGSRSQIGYGEIKSKATTPLVGGPSGVRGSWSTNAGRAEREARGGRKPPSLDHPGNLLHRIVRGLKSMAARRASPHESSEILSQVERSYQNRDRALEKPPLGPRLLTHGDKLIVDKHSADWPWKRERVVAQVV